MLPNSDAFGCCCPELPNSDAFGCCCCCCPELPNSDAFGCCCCCPVFPNNEAFGCCCPAFPNNEALGCCCPVAVELPNGALWFCGWACCCPNPPEREGWVFGVFDGVPLLLADLIPKAAELHIAVFDMQPNCERTQGSPRGKCHLGVAAKGAGM